MLVIISRLHLQQSSQKPERSNLTSGEKQYQHIKDFFFRLIYKLVFFPLSIWFRLCCVSWSVTSLLHIKHGCSLLFGAEALGLEWERTSEDHLDK